MKFRHGLVIGFAAGYYFGAKAGQERYEQLARVLDKVRATPGYPDARDRVVRYFDAGRDLALSRLDGATNGAASSFLDLRTGDTGELFDDDLTDVYDPWVEDEPTA